MRYSVLQANYLRTNQYPCGALSLKLLETDMYYCDVLASGAIYVPWLRRLDKQLECWQNWDSDSARRGAGRRATRSKPDGIAEKRKTFKRTDFSRHSVGRGGWDGCEWPGDCSPDETGGEGTRIAGVTSRFCGRE